MLYGKLQTKLAKHGLVVRAREAPSLFMKRACEAIPDKQMQITQACEIIIELRYAKKREGLSDKPDDQIKLLKGY